MSKSRKVLPDIAIDPGSWQVTGARRRFVARLHINPLKESRKSIKFSNLDRLVAWTARIVVTVTSRYYPELQKAALADKAQQSFLLRFSKLEQDRKTDFYFSLTDEEGADFIKKLEAGIRAYCQA